MRKLRAIAVSLVGVFVLLAAPTAWVAADQANPQGGPTTKLNATGDVSAAALSCRRMSAANGAGQDIFLSTADPRTYTGTVWTDVECSSTSFRLKYGERALVVSDFNAETDCNGTAPTNGQWCQTRALLNGLEGHPVAAEPSSFAIDSVAGGVNNWEANAMNRAWEVRCASTAGCQYRFKVQTRMHDASVTGMWLDELAVHLRVTVGPSAAL